jgi:hypothetical protein
VKAAATLIAFLAAGWLMANRERGMAVLRTARPESPRSPVSWLRSYRGLDPRYHWTLSLTAGVIGLVLFLTIAGVSFQSQYR